MSQDTKYKLFRAVSMLAFVGMFIFAALGIFWLGIITFVVMLVCFFISLGYEPYTPDF